MLFDIGCGCGRHVTAKALTAHELKQGSSAELGESDGLGDGLGLVQQSFDMFQVRCSGAVAALMQ